MGQPTDGSSCGCPSNGIPSWSVNLASLNLMIRDTPGFYTPGLGPKVSWDLTFNSINANPASDVGPFAYLLGPNVSCSYGIHVADLGASAHVVMGDGRTDTYTATGSGTYTPSAGTGIFNALVKNGDGSFTLTTADRSTVSTFAKLFSSGGTSYAAVTKQADCYGNALGFTYSGAAVPTLLTVADATGNASSVSYNSGGQVSQVADPFGGTVQFGYTAVNGVARLSSLTDQAGYTSTLAYDAQGRVTALTTPLTAPTATAQFAYLGTTGQVTSVTDAAGNKRSYSVGTSSVTKTDELGRVMTYGLNGFGGAATVTDALGNQTRNTYDSNRNLVQVVNARGYATASTYDQSGNRLTRTNYLNPYPDTSVSVQRSWTYDASNNVLSATDPLGTEKWTYDANNQAISWTDKLGHTTNYTHNNVGQPLTVVDRNGITAVTNTYGSNGRLAATADALGNTTKLQWDNRGRRTQVTDPAGNAKSLAYDLLDRVTTTTFPDNTTTQNAYSCCRLVQVTDQLANVTKKVFDALGRLVQVTDPTGAVTKYGYDAASNTTSMVDPNGHTWQWQYDALNRQVAQIDALNHQESRSYDAVGNLTKRVDGNNATTTYAFDALNRQVQASYPDGSTLATTYDPLGNRLTATNALGQWSWAYNANSWPIGMQSPMASVATKFAYDNEGNRTQTTDPDGNVTTTTLNKGYQVSSLGFSLSGQSETVAYQYDPRGLPTQRTLPNGVVSTYGRDALGRTTAIQHAQSGGMVLFNFAYQYDSAGNPTQETSQRWDTGVGATVAYQANYSLDARYQLTTEKYAKSGSQVLELDYTYDASGNRTKAVTTTPNNADSPVTVTSSYAADNQISQSSRTAPQDATQTTTYSEDGNGSLTQATNSASGTTSYAYDAERRLTKVGLAGGTAVQFAYDPDGRRTQKTAASGTATDYVTDGLQVLLEKNASGTTQVRYMPRVGEVVSGGVRYYLEDWLGSVVGLTDGSGNMTDAFRYDAWGNALQQQGTTNLSYTWIGEEGYYLNPDIGLYLLGLRFYAEGTGRFLTRDPIGFAGNDFNLFRYVENKPTRLTDPSGLFWAYGRHCGPQSSRRAPIDTLDRACQVHDGCHNSWWTCNPYDIARCARPLCDAAVSAATHDCALDYGGNLPAKEKCQVAAIQIATVFCPLGYPFGGIVISY